jgi:hypothetical protein
MEKNVFSEEDKYTVKEEFKEMAGLKSEFKELKKQVDSLNA